MRVITVIRKPLSEGNVAKNCLKHGTGALNIDACRVGLGPKEDMAKLSARSGGEPGFRKDSYVGGKVDGGLPPGWDCTKGRWPANLIHDGSAEVVGKFPQTGKSSGGVDKAGKFSGQYGAFAGNNPGGSVGGFGDESAARFFFSTKGAT